MTGVEVLRPAAASATTDRRSAEIASVLSARSTWPMSLVRVGAACVAGASVGGQACAASSIDAFARLTRTSPAITPTRVMLRSTSSSAIHAAASSFDASA